MESTRAFPSSSTGHARGTEWLRRRYSDATSVLTALEGTNSYGVTLRFAVTGGGCRVVDAPKPARSLRRHKGKADQLDAVRAAHAVRRIGSEQLSEANANPTSLALRIVLDARQAVRRDRTASINLLTVRTRTLPSRPSRPAFAAKWTLLACMRSNPAPSDGISFWPEALPPSHKPRSGRPRRSATPSYQLHIATLCLSDFRRFCALAFGCGRSLLLPESPLSTSKPRFQ